MPEAMRGDCPHQDLKQDSSTCQSCTPTGCYHPPTLTFVCNQIFNLFWKNLGRNPGLNQEPTTSPPRFPVVLKPGHRGAVSETDLLVYLFFHLQWMSANGTLQGSNPQHWHPAVNVCLQVIWSKSLTEINPALHQMLTWGLWKPLIFYFME